MSGESRQHYPRLYQETVRSEAAPVLDATNPEAESAPHSRMSCCLEEIRAWAGQVADYGYPHYGEFAARLEAIRDGLVATLPDATLSVPSCSEATGPFQEDIATSRDVVQAPEQVASEV
ncbi:MAG: hypothetical protein KDA85_01815, partial [Planctomycetaceae bacterium]|nr:hypothetical protein [Planctomycetaceae bacterium]